MSGGMVDTIPPPYLCLAILTVALPVILDDQIKRFNLLGRKPGNIQKGSFIATDTQQIIRGYP